MVSLCGQGCLVCSYKAVPWPCCLSSGRQYTVSQCTTLKANCRSTVCSGYLSNASIRRQAARQWVRSSLVILPLIKALGGARGGGPPAMTHGRILTFPVMMQAAARGFQSCIYAASRCVRKDTYSNEGPLKAAYPVCMEGQFQ